MARADEAVTDALDVIRAIEPAVEENLDLLVPVEQKFTIMGQLTENKLIGPDQIDFQKLMSDDSPFRTQQQG